MDEFRGGTQIKRKKGGEGRQQLALPATHSLPYLTHGHEHLSQFCAGDQTSGVRMLLVTAWGDFADLKETSGLDLLTAALSSVLLPHTAQAETWATSAEPEK